jgi:hypothetical protein
MGTRAAFWVGDPRDLSKREWLGATAWDGYPENPAIAVILRAVWEAEFRGAVAGLAARSDDFARPDRGWPYPWADDIFLTDFTYAFFDGCVQATHFHYGFVPASKVLADSDFEWPDLDDRSLRSIPAPAAYDPTQPDSILILRKPG